MRRSVAFGTLVYRPMNRPVLPPVVGARSEGELHGALEFVDVRPRAGGRMHEGDPDEALLGKTAQGDQRAFRTLMARHMGRAIRLAESIMRATADVDDIAQEAFVRVWNGAASFDPTVARFSTWLYRIVLNLAIDRSRRPRGDPIEKAGEIATDEPGALAGLIAKEERSAMVECISQLPERQRAAIALFHFEDLSGREAAAAMEMTEKAFESLLTRARTTLRQRMLGGEGRSGR
jgi:RNA polymerase sigma-70 factor (ECF subfamily)